MAGNRFLDPDVGAVTIGELFDSCRARMMVIAVDAVSQRFRHIARVSSGYGCACVCPNCGKPMVARKGILRAHSFAHRSDLERDSCTYGPETVLHHIAKDIVAAYGRIVFPEVVVSDELGPLAISAARTVRFDEVLLETRDGAVVPDVVGILGDRRLHIEFKVTHGVPAAKIDKVRGTGVSVMEVDLSSYRDVKLEDIGPIVVADAPRAALLSPIFDRGEAMLAERTGRTAREFAERQSAFSPVKKRLSRFETKLHRTFVSPFVIETLNGFGIFEVSDIEWQSWIVHTLLGRHDAPYSVGWLCGTMRRSGWCGGHENLLKPGVAAFARERLGLRARTLEDIVLRFLRHLEALRLAAVNQDGRWSATMFLADYQKNSKIKRIPKTREFQKIGNAGRFEHGKAKLREAVSAVLERQAGAEARYYDFEAWLLDLARRYAMPPFVLVTQTTLIEEVGMLRVRIETDGNAAGFPVFGLPLPGPGAESRLLLARPEK